MRLWPIALVACGRFDFDPVPDSGSNAPDAPVSTCDWTAGLPAFRPPTRVVSLSSPSDETDPALSPDGLTLYFASRRSGEYEVYRSVRASLDAPFETPVPLGPDVNTAAPELTFRLDPAGTHAYLVREVAGNVDIYEATRPSPEAAFGAFTTVTAVTSPAAELDPIESSDGLTLWFVTDRVGGMQDIWSARRASLADPWQAPAVVPELATLRAEASPTIDATQTVMVFTQVDPTTSGDLVVTRRPDSSSPWGPAEPLDAVNTALFEGEPEISADGCELLFVSTRDGNAWEIFQASAR